MDELDKKIVRCLSENARMTVKDIARRVCLTSPAVSERIRRMEKPAPLRGTPCCWAGRTPRGH